MGLRLSVERGALVVTDGIGDHCRTQRFDKATHRLSRLVVIGATGTFSIDARHVRCETCIAAHPGHAPEIRGGRGVAIAARKRALTEWDKANPDIVYDRSCSGGRSCRGSRA
jgi:hypothetical protein